MIESIETLLDAIEDDDLDDRPIPSCAFLLRCAKEIGFVEHDGHGGLWVTRRGEAFLKRKRRGRPER